MAEILENSFAQVRESVCQNGLVHWYPNPECEGKGSFQYHDFGANKADRHESRALREKKSKVGPTD